MKFYLVSSNGTQIRIDREMMRLGRALDNDIVIKDESVSRYHLTFFIKDSQLIVEDAGSQFGYIVNKSPLKGATYLKVGDTLSFGNREYTISLDGEKKSIPSPTFNSKINPNMAFNNSHSVQASYKAPLNKRPIIYGLVIIILAYLGLSDNKKEENKKTKDSDDEITMKLILPNSGYKIPTKSLTEIRSEAKFYEAMRDYNNQLYNRALLGFQESLTMNPGNDLAAEYVNITEQRIKTILKDSYKDGEKSFGTLQYRRARFQMLKILSILAEQVPGFSRRVVREISSEVAENKRLDEQEKNLLSVPCEKTTDTILCKNAKSILNSSREKLKEDDVLIGTEGASP